MHVYSLTHVADTDLLRDLKTLVARDRSTTAAVVAHIAEVDQRRLYAGAGYPSMFAYCVEELRLSEDAAYKRILAARTARRFPQLFGLLAAGRLHLTAVRFLAPHLTSENAADLIAAAEGLGRSELEVMLARRFPSAAEAARPRNALVPCVPAPTRVEPAAGDDPEGQLQLVPGPVETAVQATLGASEAEQSTPLIVSAAAAAPPERYLLQVTIGRGTHDKLRRLQALLAHAVPTGDIAQVLDRALDALLVQTERSKFGTTGRPRRRAGGRPRGSIPTRHIPSEVRRAVWERDGGRCTFVGVRGGRCSGRRFIEFDHIEPVARGGLATVENLRLRCRTHNQLEAERVFGTRYMDGKRARRRPVPDPGLGGGTVEGPIPGQPTVRPSRGRNSRTSSSPATKPPT